MAARSSIWIVGSDIILAAHRRAAVRNFLEFANLDRLNIDLFWLTFSANLCSLSPFISSLLLIYPAPILLILHVGGEAIGRYRTLALLADLKQEFLAIHRILPFTVLVFSEILPRFDWSFSSLKFLDKIRKRCNKCMEKFLPLLNGFSFRHKDFEDLLPGFYLLDGFSLSEIGLDLFNLELQEMVELGLLRFGGP